MNEALETWDYNLHLHYFINHWRKEIDRRFYEGTEAGTEMRLGHKFWIDFIECFNISRHAMEFERDTRRPGTGRSDLGRIDMFIPGIAIGEIKSMNVPVEKAATQVMEYVNQGFDEDIYPAVAIATNFKEFIFIPLLEERPPIKVPLTALTQHPEYLDILSPLGRAKIAQLRTVLEAQRLAEYLEWREAEFQKWLEQWLSVPVNSNTTLTELEAIRRGEDPHKALELRKEKQVLGYIGLGFGILIVLLIVLAL